MNEGRWVLAKISTVHLGLPDLQHEATIQRVLVAGRVFKKRVHREAAKHGSRCPECSRNPRFTATLKRDVSDESRVPAGQPGGGEWTSGESGGVSTKPLSNPLLIPAQAIAPPIVAPFELPLPPTEITPFPITTPNIEPLNPTANPYPDRPECVKEWADAIKFCLEKERKGEFKPGYSGFGKNFQKCVLGMVSEGCGGNPTA
jgi:hypothetical protein